MQEQVSKKPLVDILSEMMGSAIVMSSDKYVYLEKKIEVSQSEIDEAVNIQDNLFLTQTKELKIASFSQNFEVDANQTIVYADIVYKGGESSASAIAGAVTLAQALGEDKAVIIDASDSENILSFEQTLELSSLIGKQWRDTFFKYKSFKKQVNTCTTVAEVEAIVWA
jgi:hypothetical protein